MRTSALIVVFAVCLGALVAAAGCSISDTPSGGSNGGGMMGGGASSGGQGGGMMGGGSSPSAYSSAGERIFLSGVGSDGQNIPRTAPRVSQGSLMMGGGGCGSCHGADGRGGTIRMMTGTDIEAPDITFDALIAEGFSEATIRTGIRDGLDERGKPLNEAMPRWQMSDADLAATIAYLKELAAR
jgi:mono/diheme cytochrome c family protein